MAVAHSMGREAYRASDLPRRAEEPIPRCLPRDTLLPDVQENCPLPIGVCACVRACCLCAQQEALSL